LHAESLFLPLFGLIIILGFDLQAQLDRRRNRRLASDSPQEFFKADT
jgi:hypothetical protein